MATEAKARPVWSAPSGRGRGRPSGGLPRSAQSAIPRHALRLRVTRGQLRLRLRGPEAAREIQPAVRVEDQAAQRGWGEGRAGQAAVGEARAVEPRKVAGPSAA